METVETILLSVKAEELFLVISEFKKFLERNALSSSEQSFLLFKQSFFQKKQQKFETWEMQQLAF